MAAIAPPGGAFLPAYQPLFEDSCVLKMLAMIPVIGLIPRCFVHNSLVGKLAATTDQAKVIEIIRVKNDYKTASTISSMISVSLLIAAMATGIISGIFGFSLSIGSIVFLTFLAIVGNNDINENNRAIRDLLINGQTNYIIS